MTLNKANKNNDLYHKLIIVYMPVAHIYMY